MYIVASECASMGERFCFRSQLTEHPVVSEFIFVTVFFFPWPLCLQFVGLSSNGLKIEKSTLNIFNTIVLFVRHLLDVITLLVPMNPSITL